MKKLKIYDFPLKPKNYKEINHDLITYSKDYTATNVLPSYLRHEIEK